MNSNFSEAKTTASKPAMLCNYIFLELYQGSFKVTASPITLSKLDLSAISDFLSRGHEISSRNWVPTIPEGRKRSRKADSARLAGGSFHRQAVELTRFYRVATKPEVSEPTHPILKVYTGGLIGFSHIYSPDVLSHS